MSVQAMAWAWRQTAGDPGAKLVLMKLADNADEQGYSFWRQKRLAEECEVSRATLQRKLAQLVDLELVEVEPRERSNGSQSSNGYRLRGVPQFEAGGVPAQVRQGVPAQVRHLEPSVEPSESNAPNGASPSSFSHSKAAIQQVYDHWRSVRGKLAPRYNLMTGARRAKIQTRLREFTVDELKRALDAVDNDPWKERDQHDDLTQLFRSRETVDRWLELADGKPGSKERAHARRLARLERLERGER